VSRFDKIPLLAKSKLPIYEGDTLQYIATSNAPLRAEKGTVYEGGVREPLIVKWPGNIEAGSTNNALVSSVDFYPTILVFAGIDPEPGWHLDGESLAEMLINSKNDKERAIYWHYPVYHHGVPASAIRKGDFKLIQNLVDGSLELYNLKTDIGETQNLADTNPEKARELMELLKAWQKDVAAEFPVPNPEFDASKRYEWGRHPDRP
jgi:uncharacterized sulfatase